MKTKRTLIFAGFITLAITVFVLSCNNPVGLGAMLDIDGPVVEFTSPASRDSVTTSFVIEGTVSDASEVDQLILTVDFARGQYGKRWRYTRIDAKTGKWEVAEAASFNDLSGDNITTGGIVEDISNDDVVTGWKDWEELPDATPLLIGKSATWTIPINMTISGRKLKDGVYTFSIKASDISGFSNDNSFKTLVLIVDNSAPSIDISNPYLYSRNLEWTSPAPPYFKPLADKNTNVAVNDARDLNDLYKGANDAPDATRFNSRNLGKFLTQDFLLQWQIDDYSDINRIELYFYDEEGSNNFPNAYNANSSENYNRDVFDQVEDEHDLPDNYILKYEKTVSSSTGIVRTNGSLPVPILHNKGGSPSTFLYDGGEGRIGRLLDYDTPKVIMVYSRCFDAANIVNDEKILGYFLYWGLAGEPWIEFTEGMRDPNDTGLPNPKEVFYGQDVKDIQEQVFMIYPGRNVKATAFQAHGVGGVRYAVYKCDVDASNKLVAPTKSDPLDMVDVSNPNGILIRNQPRVSGASLSNIFAWDFRPPAQSGYYVVEAYAYGSKNGVIDETDPNKKSNPISTALFRVQDISFPHINENIDPPAGNQMFMHPDMKNGKFTIKGTATDATRITSIYMVWINPKSRDFAAMSQLSYFRDPDYGGWNILKGGIVVNDSQGDQLPLSPYSASSPGDKRDDPIYDHTAPNKLWNIETKFIGEDDNGRQIYEFSVTIDLLADLGIGVHDNPLTSQVFLLRAENPDGKCHIREYAPLGDTLGPSVKIDRMEITRNNGTPRVFIPGRSDEIPKFETNQTNVITIFGSWEEDSIRYLDFDEYFRRNFEVSLTQVQLTNREGLALDESNAPLTGVTITHPDRGNGTGSGRFEVRVQLGGRVGIGTVRDTIMVNVKVRDYGGTPAEAAASWLVQGDRLGFVRITSAEEDKTYKAFTDDPTPVPQKIEIYIEFSKAVRLNLNASAAPVLVLSSATGEQAFATFGRIDGSQRWESRATNVVNTRQYFTYEILPGHNTHTTANPGFLNVIGLRGGDTGGQNAANYRFMWEHELNTGEHEYVRIVSPQSNPPAGTTALATSGTQALNSTRSITIDTEPPRVATNGVSAVGVGSTPVFLSKDREVQIQVQFTEAVDISGLPVLNLNAGTTAAPIARTTTSVASDISVSGSTITFKYIVQDGDNTGANALTITGYTGTITDLVGNAAVIGNNPVTNVRLDTDTPLRPMIEIVPYNNTTAITNTVNGASVTARSNSSGTNANWTPSANISSTPSGSGTFVNLSNVYQIGPTANDKVRIRITPYGNLSADYSTLEYSTNDGRDWTPVNVVGGTAIFTLTDDGRNTITARQTDAAGNVSYWTHPIFMNYDPGNIITRIDSTTPNGTYSNATSTNTVNVTVHFRKPLNVSAGTITLNARNGTQTNFIDRAVITVPVVAVTNATSLSFTHTIVNNDNTPSTPVQTLDVTGINFTATDMGVGVANTGVAVPNTFLTLPADTNMRLGNRKEIYIQTGPLAIITQPAFVNGTIAADGSYEATLRVVFNRNIIKRTGNFNIVIIQNTGTTSVNGVSTTNYRLPAVLTEAQRNKYRGIPGFDTYYTIGTNGLNDTSTKYILRYDINTALPVNTTNYPPPNYTSADVTALQAFVDEFRDRESVTIPVSSSAVTINGATLDIALTGGNALQVPGATYSVTIPAGLVGDALNYTSPAPTNNPGNITATDTAGTNSGFVAKPFVRIRRAQDTLALRTGTDVASGRFARVRANQPLTTDAKIDCRTPGTRLYYHTTNSPTTTNALNWGTGGPNDLNAPAAPGNPEDPRTTANNRNEYSTTVITIGAVTGADYQAQLDNVQGLRWRILAKATTNTGTNPANTAASWSDGAEEIAYRSVLTYQVRDMQGYVANQNPGQTLVTTDTTPITTNGNQNVNQTGNQVWVRGGDAISSSNIPGFPLNWDKDETDALEVGQRAGIRLLDQIESYTPSGSNMRQVSRWRWVTWEVNVDTYFDIIMGKDDNSSVDTLTTKGPKQFAYQRAGWTSFKTESRLLPGKHRWLYIDGDNNFQSKGTTNFALPYEARPD